jgi:hypothetical protein
MEGISMKKVKCIDNNGANELDLEKQYHIIKEDDAFYTISTKEGVTANYLKKRFEVVEITVELDIIEASNMPLGTEFQMVRDGIKMPNTIYINKNNKSLRWKDVDEVLYPSVSNLNAIFIPIKNQKPVTFEEARKEYRHNKKSIKSCVSERLFKNGIDAEIGFLK